MGYVGEQKRAYQREWMRKRRQAWIDENGPCVDCGSWDDLEVDHVDPAEKSFNPAQIWSRRAEVRLAELAKCVARCVKCHLKKTVLEKSCNGEENPNAKLNLAAASDIREKYRSNNYTRQKLAEEYKVSWTTINDIVNMRRWK